ncbi:ospE1 [Shigella flexneri K-218]|nr:ospE1 [Shigella flexneri K-218]
MLTQTIFPCLPQKQENIILEVSNPVLLSSTVTTDGYTVFNKKQLYTNYKYLLPTGRKR